MTPNQRPDETDVLRQELAALGVPQGRQPEDDGLNFRPVDSFFKDDPPGPLERRRSRRVRMTVFAAGLAAAVVVAVAVIPRATTPSKPDPEVVSPQLVPVAQILRIAGEASGAQPDLGQDAPYWRVRSVQQQGDDEPVERTIWLGQRRSGVLVDDGVRTSLPPATFGLQRSVLSWDELAALPTDRSELQQLLEQEAAGLPDPTWLMAKLVGELLAETPAPPEVRRALWLVVAEIPGVSSGGAATDAMGREGVLLSLASETRGTLEYILDPESGLILQTVVKDRNALPPFRTTFVSSGPAHTAP